VRNRSRSGVIPFDDPQNATPTELKTPLARIGEDSAGDHWRPQPLQARPSLQPGASRAAASLIKVVLAAIVRPGVCAMLARASATTVWPRPASRLHCSQKRIVTE
jgi:hypothetical protein